MTDEYAQAGTAAKRLTEAGFPAVRTSAGYPAYGGGGDEGLDNNSVIVWLHAGTADRLAAMLASIAVSGSIRARDRRNWPGMSGVADETLRDILLLLDRQVPLAVIAQWSDRERLAACEWASLAHLSASDNPVRTVDEPWFVKVAAGIEAAVPAARDGSRRDAEVAAFAGECLDVVEPEDGVPGPSLLDICKAYGDWAQRHGCMAMALSPFHATLRQFHVSEQTDDGARFPGLRLKGQP